MRVALNCGAALAIWRITGDLKKTLSVLIKAISNTDESYPDRLRAVRALGQMGRAAKSAVPHLEKLLKDNSPVLRRGAAATLKEIRRERKKLEKAKAGAKPAK